MFVVKLTFDTLQQRLSAVGWFIKNIWADNWVYLKLGWMRHDFGLGENSDKWWCVKCSDSFCEENCGRLCNIKFDLMAVQTSKFVGFQF